MEQYDDYADENPYGGEQGPTTVVEPMPAPPQVTETIIEPELQDPGARAGGYYPQGAVPQHQQQQQQAGARPPRDRSTNILIAIIGSALFVAIVVTVGLFLYYPGAGAQGESVVEQVPGGGYFDPIEYLRDGSGDPEAPITDAFSADPTLAPPVPLTSEPGAAARAPVGDEGGVVFVETAPPAAATASSAPAAAAAPAARVIRQQRGVTVAENVPASAPAGKQAAATDSPAGREPAAAPAASPSRTAAAAPTAPPAAAARTPAVAADTYWVQLFSSQQRDSAEQARKLLATHNIVGVISQTQDSRGVFYRLRVGPFTNRNEAEKFKEWFGQTDSFSNGFIVRTRR